MTLGVNQCYLLKEDSCSVSRLKWQKEEEAEESGEDKKYFSAGGILPWEKKHSKINGKYIEALQAGISSQISCQI